MLDDAKLDSIIHMPAIHRRCSLGRFRFVWESSFRLRLLHIFLGLLGK
jgi:hypothetical protein